MQRLIEVQCLGDRIVLDSGFNRARLTKVEDGCWWVGLYRRGKLIKGRILYKPIETILYIVKTVLSAWYVDPFDDVLSGGYPR